MDRLICGDVGFGKTEVAMRAAFLVAISGRQVLVLAPTTLLVQQHLQTFRDRFRDFPVRVEAVSRMREAGDVKQALREFAEGKIEVLIGTHRVLSRDVIPKQLGLIVIDEEQRFGVRQKELLRQLRLEVDVLSMSATPIPRTLHMSLAGLRDISVIATPPRGRQPIRTHVAEYDETLVAAAIRREIGARGPGLLPAQPRRDDPRGGREDPPARARGARRRRARTDGRPRAGAGDGGVPARRPGRARRDHDHRERARHPAGQHARHRARRRARAGAAVPDPRARRPWRERRARLPDVPGRQRAVRGGTGAARGAGRLHGARLGLPRGAARSRAARRRAACSATSSRGTSPRSASSSTATCSRRPSPS